MRRKCDSCGRSYEAQTARSKFCRDAGCLRRRARERKRASDRAKRGRGSVVAMPGQAEERTRIELERAGRLESALGEIALALARRIDQPQEVPAASLPALTRELRTTLHEATRSAEPVGDVVDELKERRRARLAGG